MTKQEAIDAHRKMWRWLVSETTKQQRKVEKYEYFDAMGISNIPNNECYCCEYSRQQCKILRCVKCPIDWKSSVSVAMCCDKIELEDEKNLFSLWCRAENWQEAARLAAQIAELPERED